MELTNILINKVGEDFMLATFDAPMYPVFGNLTIVLRHMVFHSLPRNLELTKILSRSNSLSLSLESSEFFQIPVRQNSNANKMTNIACQNSYGILDKLGVGYVATYTKLINHQQITDSINGMDN